MVGRPDVPRDRIELVGRDVQAVAFRVLEFQVLLFDAVHAAANQAAVPRDAVVRVDQVIADLERRNEVGSHARPCSRRPPPLPEPEDLRVGDEDELVIECPTPASGKRHKRDAPLLRRRTQLPVQVDGHALLVHQVRKPKRLLRRDNHRLPIPRPAVDLLHERLQLPCEAWRGLQRQPPCAEFLGPEPLQVNHHGRTVQRARDFLRRDVEGRQTNRDVAASLEFRPGPLLVVEQRSERFAAFVCVVEQHRRVRVQVVERRRFVEQRLEERLVVGALAAGQQFELLQDGLGLLPVGSQPFPEARCRASCLARPRGCRGEVHVFQPPNAALRRDIDLPDAVDLVPEELDAVRRLVPGREDVHDAAPPRHRPRPVGDMRNLVPRRFERSHQLVGRARGAHAQVDAGRLHLRAGTSLGQRRPRCHDERPVAASQQAQCSSAFDAHHRVVANPLVWEPLPFGQARQGHMFQVKREFVGQRLRARRRRRQQEGRGGMPCRERCSHGGFGLVGHTKTHAGAQYSFEYRRQHIGDAYEFARHGMPNRPAPAPGRGSDATVANSWVLRR